MCPKRFDNFQKVVKSNTVSLYMTTKKISKKKLSKIIQKRKPIDLDKYAGKIDFGIDGLEYQLKVRNEWQ